MGTLPVERTSFEAALTALLAEYESGSGGGTILATRLPIVNMVKLKLDELLPEGEGVVFTLETTPNISNPLDLFINGMLDECTKHVLLLAPIHVLEPISASPTPTHITTYSNGRKVGYIELPYSTNVFLRLFSFKMSDWERPVITPITTADKRYLRQGNQWLCGSLSKPVAVLTHRDVSGTIRRVLEYYTTQASTHTLSHFLYVPETLPENLQDNITDALTWYCAAKMLQITERLDLADKAMAQLQLCFNNM